MSLESTVMDYFLGFIGLIFVIIFIVTILAIHEIRTYTKEINRKLNLILKEIKKKNKA